MPLNIVILLGTVRSDRRGLRVARFVERLLAARGHAVTLVDPLAGLYRAADAFVVVSGEYNHSIPPALSNLLDYFLEEYFWRPSGIVCYSFGQFGGVRAAMQLRAMLCELGMPSISSLFPVPRVEQALNENGASPDGGLEGRFARFADELEWHARALAAARAQGVPY